MAEDCFLKIFIHFIFFLYQEWSLIKVENLKIKMVQYSRGKWHEIEKYPFLRTSNSISCCPCIIAHRACKYLWWCQKINKITMSNQLPGKSRKRKHLGVVPYILETVPSIKRIHALDRVWGGSFCNLHTRLECFLCCGRKFVVHHDKKCQNVP